MYSVSIDEMALTIGHPIHVRDLTLPAGVTVLDDPDATVVAVAAPRTTEAVTPTPAEAISAEPEVIRAKKPEE